MLDYWSEHPPAHVLLAAMMQARPLRKRKLGDLLSAVAGAGGILLRQPSSHMKNLLGANTKVTKETNKVTESAS